VFALKRQFPAVRFLFLPFSSSSKQIDFIFLGRVCVRSVRFVRVLIDFVQFFFFFFFLCLFFFFGKKVHLKAVNLGNSSE